LFKLLKRHLAFISVISVLPIFIATPTLGASPSPKGDSTKGVTGLFIKEVAGAEITSLNSDYAFDPASSLKALVALYAFNQIISGKINLEQTIPSITSSNPHGCSKFKSNTTETLQQAIKQMMQISDNDRTTALIKYFNAKKLNAFAKSIGLKKTTIKLVQVKPGFIPIGCVDPKFDQNDPKTVSGNYSSLRDLTKIWETASNLKEPFRQQFMNLTAGREMFETEGYDYSGIWSEIVKISREEAPVGLSSIKVGQFLNLIHSNTKGGSNSLCYKTANCTNVRWWVSIINLTTIPYCSSDGGLSSRTYVWGYFSAKFNSNSAIYEEANPALTSFFRVRAEPLRELIRNSLNNWEFCSA